MLLVRFRSENDCAGYAYAETDSMCPSEVGHNWRYNGDGDSWHDAGNDGTSWSDAGKGLLVKCISEAGKLRMNNRAAQMNVKILASS